MPARSRSAVCLFLGTSLALFAAVAAAGAVVNVSRTLVEFGYTPALVHVTQPVFVTNTGDAPLNISVLSLSGDNAADFILGGTCVAPITLPAGGGRCRIDITSNLAGTGRLGRTATLTVLSDTSLAIATISVVATWDAFAPETILTPTWIDFPAQTVGTSAQSQIFTFSDNTDVGFRLDQALFRRGDGADFAVTTGCATLTPGASCTLTIGFVPTATGPRSTELEIDYSTFDAVPPTMRVRWYSVTGVGGVAGPPLALDLNQHGLTGSWYRLTTSGQGIEVEVFADQVAPGTGQAFVSWFTYDTIVGGADHQRWYTLSGTVTSGQRNAALTIYQNMGGNFNSLPTTAAQKVGTATLNFASCTSGQLAYNFTDGSGRSGTIPLTRLTQNVTCSTNTPYPTNADFALSGNWYDATTAGQGFTVEVNPITAYLFAAWYTYAPMGAAAGAAGQRWYTAQASFTSGMRSIPVTIYETTGGIFNAPLPAAQTLAVGTGTLAFQSCTAATFSYNFAGGSSSGLSGTINLSRVGPVPPGCTS